MTLDEASENVGAFVVYVENGEAEDYGFITRVTEQFVFVDYEENGGIKATSPEDLEWADGR